MNSRHKSGKGRINAGYVGVVAEGVLNLHWRTLSVSPNPLLEIFIRRHEKASTIITTNRPTEDWAQLLGDVPATTAILDRFLAHAEIIKMQGKSYRLHHRARQQSKKKEEK